MVTDQPEVDTPFHSLDDLGGTLDKTKGLFAVIDSQPDAAREWNKSAYQNALGMQQSFADFAKEHHDLPKGDQRLDDLQSSARLLGVIDGGMSQETLSNIKNGQMDADQALQNAKDAYEFKRDIIRSVFSYGPGGDLVNNTFADTFAGDPHIDDRFFDKNGQLKPPSQIDETDWSLYDSQLTASMAGQTQINAMMSKFGTTFSHIGGYNG